MMIMKDAKSLLIMMKEATQSIKMMGEEKNEEKNDEQINNVILMMKMMKVKESERK